MHNISDDQISLIRQEISRLLNLTDNLKLWSSLKEPVSWDAIILHLRGIARNVNEVLEEL